MVRYKESSELPINIGLILFFITCLKNNNKNKFCRSYKKNYVKNIQR